MERPERREKEFNINHDKELAEYYGDSQGQELSNKKRHLSDYVESNPQKSSLFLLEQVVETMPEGTKKEIVAEQIQERKDELYMREISAQPHILPDIDSILHFFPMGVMETPEDGKTVRI